MKQTTAKEKKLSEQTKNLFSDHVPLMRPWMDERESEAIAEVIRSGWITQGQKVIDFENVVASYVGTKYGIATNSCTSGLHLSLRILGVKPGDKVICPSFTCMATANAIHMAGANPVFADIEPKTYNLDPLSVEALITPDVKAILLVHQIGLPADREIFEKLAAEHNLLLIEDGACSFGATYKGEALGANSLATSYSFHPRKMITTGEGGMIVTNDAAFAEKARALRSTGASISDLERHKAKGVLVQEYHESGYNYRLTDMQAAVGLVQMTRLAEMLKQRRDQAEAYDTALKGQPGIETPFVPEYATHSFSSYCIRLTKDCPVSRDLMLREMAQRGISCRTGIQPLHHEPFYKKEKSVLRSDLPETEKAARETMFLPIFPGMTRSQQEKVCSSIAEILQS